MTDKHEYHLGHIVPYKTYFNVFLALIVLTVITVVVATQVHFSSPTISLIVAMLIATVKASLVAMYFMHLKYEHPIIWLFAIFPIILLLILIGGVFLDNPFRVVPATF